MITAGGGYKLDDQDSFPGRWKDILYNLIELTADSVAAKAS
jgi:hypothetical protein